MRVQELRTRLPDSHRTVDRTERRGQLAVRGRQIAARHQTSNPGFQTVNRSPRRLGVAAKHWIALDF